MFLKKLERADDAVKVTGGANAEIDVNLTHSVGRSYTANFKT